MNEASGMEGALPAAGLIGTQWPSIAGIPLDFVLFALTLAGVALFHRRVLQIALSGLGVICVYKLLFTGFREGAGLGGLASHLFHEWVVLANLLCLLLGFALLANHFERSRLSDVLPRMLPEGVAGAFALLVLIAVLSSFLDNIAAALIGGAIARNVFGGRVHIGYVAAIVAASNAGGSGSVVGDTTTTMMWISGISPLNVLHAYVAAVVAVVVCGIPAALQQHALQPLARVRSAEQEPVDRLRVGVVFLTLIFAVTANVLSNVVFTGVADVFPVLGVAVWLVLLLCAFVRQPDWSILPESFKGSIFLLSLVTCASLMPVEQLPVASWHSAFALGFVSAVFDNIPLTALALKQGGYDWGMLAYTVGFGGSMIWFGSSAGVAISSFYPEARSALAWIRNGWHVTLAYVLGFLVLLVTVGWRPELVPH